MPRITIPATVLLLFTAATATAARVYTCTDAGGGVQYRDTPCDSRTHSLRRLDAPPTATAAPDARRRRRCHRARDDLRSLEQAGRVYLSDEGRERALDAARAEERQWCESN